jgi:hypothetical protein
MIYKFKSQATADLVLLGPQGDAMLRLLGREPAPKGIIEVGSMPGALAVLEAAVAQAALATSAELPPTLAGDEAADDPAGGVGLRQRLWPVIEMLRRALAAGSPVVWGV